MNNSGNQIRSKMIRQFSKTDRGKLGGLEIFLHKRYPDWKVYIEPFMLFEKGEDVFVRCVQFANEHEVNKYKIYPPDIWVIRNTGKPLVLELDGEIHNIKMDKTDKRNKLFEVNNIEYVIVNEVDLKFELRLTQSADLSQQQINEAFQHKISQLG